jgi:hypothetical protein
LVFLLVFVAVTLGFLAFTAAVFPTFGRGLRFTLLFPVFTVLATGLVFATFGFLCLTFSSAMASWLSAAFKSSPFSAATTRSSPVGSI